MKKILIITFLIFATFVVLAVKANSQSGKIYMTISQQSQQNQTISSPLKLGIKITTQNQPFFGTAFHVNFDSRNYKFQNYTLGDFFTTQDQPLVLVKDNNDGIVMVGLSLTQGKTIIKSDGTLLTLNFIKTTELSLSPQYHHPDFTFSHTVFSTFNKARQDINNFVFQNL